MSRVHVLLVVVFIFVFAATALAGPVKTVAEVYTPNLPALDRLHGFDLGFESSDRPMWSRVVGSRETIEELAATGFEVEIVIDDLDAWVAGRSAALRKMPPDSAPADVVLDHYLTHAEMTTFLDDLAAAYSDIMTIEVLGYSVNNLALFQVKISDNVAVNEDEPAVYFEHNIHGDEIAGYILALYTIEWLVTNYDTDPDIQALVNGRELFFEPLTNPDGNVDVPGWGRGRYNENGVDLNRNFGFMWDPDEWNSGSAAHSEPETKALTESWARTQPYSAAFSGHSGTIIMLYPWGYNFDSPPDIDAFDYLGEQYIYPNFCTDPNFDFHGTCAQALYQAVGVTNDEQYGSHGALGFTYEITYTKECSYTTSQQVWVDHQPAIEWFLGEIGNGLHGAVTETGSGTPIGALVEVVGKWYTFSDHEVGDFHKYLRAGTYDLHVSANGYLDDITSVTIVDGTPTHVDIELTPDPDPKTFAWRWMISEMPNSYQTDYPPTNVFGPPDDQNVGLGFGGYVVLDLGPDGIADGVGADLMVFEGGTDGDEDFHLDGSATSMHGPWTSLGNGSGTTPFDLNGTGLATVRWVKISDGASRDAGLAGPDDGFDLDAVGSPTFVAAFGATPTTGEPPLMVQFSDVSTGEPTAWEWDFGDGSAVSYDQHPSHEYAAIGQYDVTLTVTASGGMRTLTKFNFINVAFTPPTIDFTATPNTGVLPLEVQFTSSATGTITAYDWSFGDGGTSTEADPFHVYEGLGPFSVNLEVTGPGGSNSRYRWRYIRPSCASPVADFEADVTSGEGPLTVDFTNLTNAPEACPTTFSWAFGDGGQSSEEHPEHVFAEPGLYTISLTATSSTGTDTETKADYIDVHEGDDDDDDDNDDDDDDDNDDDDDDDNDDDDDDNDDDDATDDDVVDDDDDDDDDDDSGCGC